MKKVFAMFGRYLINVCVDFVEGFKIAPQKVVTYISLVPGLVYGLLMDAHYATIYLLPVQNFAPYPTYNFTGILIFLIFIATCINMFNGFSFVKKNNLTKCLSITFITLIVLAAGIGYIYLILDANKIRNIISGKVLTSLITIGITMLFTVIMNVFAFVYRNKNYVKVKE